MLTLTSSTWVQLIGLVAWILSHPVNACIDESAMKALADKEMQYMLKRIPPAFVDAVTDGVIQGKMMVVAADTCQVRWQLMLPAGEIAEAQALLQADPAKRIMLSAQGYELPEKPVVTAEFSVDAANVQPRHEDTLQTGPLGKLRASVELMYAMLTQARANEQTSGRPWSAEELQSAQASCQQQFRAPQSAPNCECYVQGLAEKYTLRQVRYNQYLSTNPYAFATGNGASFKRLDKSLKTHCGLTLLQ